MAQRPNIEKRQSKKPSGLVMIFALVIACSLPYYLVKNFAHHKKTDLSTSAAPNTPSSPLERIRIIDEFEPSITTALKTSKTESNSKTLTEGITAEVIQTVKNEAKKVLAKAKPKVKDNEWQTIRPRSGDSMATIFHRLGLSAKNLHEILQNKKYTKALTAIKPSQELKFLINKGHLEKLIIPVDYVDTLTISRAIKGYNYQISSKKTTSQAVYVTATVNGSLYTTAQKANIPYKFVKSMTEILKREVDFSHVSSGDQFSIVYDAYYVGDKMVGTGDIVAVTYTNKGKTTQAIRHTSANGTTDYYSAQGNSFKKAFSRYPIKFSHISSTFALSRYHPILDYKRAHKGIDLAAPIGTPIQATGDGVITIIDRHNGYGNMIKIKHDKKYSTIYGHMLKFQKGLSKGSKVKRGQVIGYVGQTGLATGPHCHYELHVNNAPHNPTTTSLPTASPIPAREMKAFKAKTNALLARLKLFEAAQLASKGRNKNHKLG
ncbi:peptidoglycan DD-metalloendopeptidase family protein [Legionella sp. km772]|uniref:M23 family metallopeptidase n=1 Tax=Legionella sp. km772 TaxID=2498111 RepID=UPI000F8D1A63|nr:peptidoglycan DD-metalloendopeptidase family protein [Legionella sp. km772]RUR08679.1 peptidase M24 [Legionella sp. km772]